MSIIQRDEQAAMDFLASAIQPFAEMTGSLALLATFVAIARKGPRITIGDIARATGLKQSSTTRQCQDLSNVNREGGVGLGLIEQKIEGLYRFNSLTPKGQALVRRMAGVGQRKMAA